jgi:hypothetical protein
LGHWAGANMAFRNAIESVNYFDDRLDVGAAGCSGDSEIWFRILANNMNSIIQEPTSIMNIERYQTTTQTAFLVICAVILLLFNTTSSKKKLDIKILVF